MRLDPQPAPATPAPTVLKFGGAGLSDGEGVWRACQLVREHGGERPIVVVSAIGEVTVLLDEALRAAEGGAPDSSRVRLRHKSLLAQLGLPPGLVRRHLSELETLLSSVAGRAAVTPAERDHALSLGERMSARIFAAALREAGVAATPVDAWDLGLLSDSDHGHARPLRSALGEIGRALARLPGVPVVTGFVAADANGRLTTLGRSGSDLTATLLAEAAGAREVQLWKTVGGVMSADPRLVPQARTLRELSWSQAAALAFHGAGVLHPDALEPLERARVSARVLDLDHPDDPGTHIGPVAAAHGVLGIACRRGVALLRAASGVHAPPTARPKGLFAALAEHGVEPLALVTGPGESALVAPDADPLARLEARLALRAPTERGLAALALVAAQAGELAAAAGHAALARAQITPHLSWIDSARASALWVLPATQLAAAACALHELTLPHPRDRPILQRSTP